MKEGKGVVDSFDFCAPYVSCDVQLRMKVLYGVYIIIQSHALLICQPFVENSFVCLLLCNSPGKLCHLSMYRQINYLIVRNLQK